MCTYVNGGNTIIETINTYIPPLIFRVGGLILTTGCGKEEVH